ncbi:MAG: hypothetical protein AMS17_07520, partial [Spirochaetes bacterium DG_61]
QNGGKNVSRDIGIVVGRDIVAVEKAAYDLFLQANGKPIQEYTYPHVDPLLQVKHAAELGLGSIEYRIVEVRSV